MSTYYYLPTRNVFGAGSVSEVGALMDSLGGKRTMFVTDSFLANHPMTTKSRSSKSIVRPMRANCKPTSDCKAPLISQEISGVWTVGADSNRKPYVPQYGTGAVRHQSS